MAGAYAGEFYECGGGIVKHPAYMYYSPRPALESAVEGSREGVGPTPQRAAGAAETAIDTVRVAPLPAAGAAPWACPDCGFVAAGAGPGRHREFCKGHEVAL